MLGSKTSAKQLTPSALVSQRAALEQTIQGLTTKLTEAEAVATDAASDDAAYRAAAEKVSALRAELHSQRERAERLDGIMADVARTEQSRLVAEIETAIRQVNANTTSQDIRRLELIEEARHVAVMERLARTRAAKISCQINGRSVSDCLSSLTLSLGTIIEASRILDELSASRDAKRVLELLDAAEAVIADRALSNMVRMVNAPHSSGQHDFTNPVRAHQCAAEEESVLQRDSYLLSAARISGDLARCILAKQS